MTSMASSTTIPRTALRSSVVRGLPADVLGLAVSTLASWGLLTYLHGVAPSWWLALACGSISGIALRRFARSAYGHFPSFLARLFDIGTVTIGTLVSVVGTLALYPQLYLVPRLSEAFVLSALAAALGLGLGALVYTHTRFGEEIGIARSREAVLEEEALRARLRALQAQIHPHFLFNALNSLSELTHEDPHAAERMVGDIAHLLRYSLETSAAERVTLAQELEATERYLAVERTRLGERLRIERHIDTTLLGTQLPGLVIQPLIENAVQHAVAPRTAGGQLVLTVEPAGEARVRIIVEDDGPGLPQEARTALAEGVRSSEATAGRGTGGAGGGLLNVARRLELVYRGAAQLEASTSARGGARLTLELPR